MRRLLLILAAAFLFSPLFSAPESTDPDFSGAWVLDKDRSFSNPAGLEQTLTIFHGGDALKLEAKLKTAAQGEQLVDEAWTLDGQEREYVPGGSAPGTKAKGKAYWLAGRRAIVIDDERTTPGQKGPVTQHTTRKLALSPDGTTLTVDYYFDTPRGQFESKRVFVRRAGAVPDAPGAHSSA